MKILSSANGQTHAMLPTRLFSYFMRCDGGALVNKKFDADLTKVLKNGEFEQHTVATKGEVIIVPVKNRPHYSPLRSLSLGDFYKNELFREVFCFPLKGWILDEKSKEYKEKNEEDSHVFVSQALSTFLFRGRSIDEFSNMIAPFEAKLFFEWQKNAQKLSKEFTSPEAYADSKASSFFHEYIFIFEFVYTEKGIKPHYYLEWSYRLPETQKEKDMLEISEKIANDPSLSEIYLINAVTEKAHHKALELRASQQQLPGQTHQTLPKAS